jgi:opacity protein-like surface antigen
MKLHHLIALIALTGSVHAGTDTSKNPAPVTTAPAGDGWWFRAAPYAWVTAVEGDVGVGPLSTPVDISMSDTLDSVDMTFMGLFEAGYGKLSVGVDVVYGKLSQDVGGGGHLFDSFRFEQKQWLLTPFVAYNVVKTDRYHMDVFAGAQFTILEVELTGRFVGPGEIVSSHETDWIDPIIGIRGQAELTETLFFRYNGEIGGFGVSSDLIWQAFLGLGYHVNENVNVAVGYRALGIDYSDGGFTFDTVSHGPVIGLEVRF